MGQAFAQEREIARGQMGTHVVMSASELERLKGSGNGVEIVGNPGDLYEHTTVDLQGDGQERVTEGVVPANHFYVRRISPTLVTHA